MIKKTLSILSKKERFLFWVLVGLSFFVAVIELVGISAIMPFVAVASDFSLVSTNEKYRFFYELFGFSSPVSFIAFFGVCLVGFYIFRSLINLVYVYALARFTHGRYHIIVFRLFENYLGMSYKNFTTQNSSKLTKTIVTEAGYFVSLISAFLFMFSEFSVALLIYAALLYTNYKITLLVTIILAINALLIVLFVSPKMKKAGQIRDDSQNMFYEVVNSSFGNFKMIKLMGGSRQILQEFSQASGTFASSKIMQESITHIPRLILEAISFVILVFVVVFLVLKYESDISSTIALISVFILGLYRLMPSANRILTSYNNITYYKPSLENIHADIFYDVEELQDEKIDFKEKVQITDLGFSYDETNQILKNVSFNINKGDKLAVIGQSGAGKSTLVDLVIGLYRPQAGQIKVDGATIDEKNLRSWRKKIGYIPQDVYLFDGSVAQNICFNKEIDVEKTENALSKAQILDFLQTNHDGIYTRVGEGGILLSGGQKQRIAIARALYSNPEILVLDEATSALDETIESKIMDEIYDIAQDKTLIIIAHRLSTIKRCDKVLEVKNSCVEQKQ